MRLLHVAAAYPPSAGAAARAVGRIARALVRAGHAVTVVVPTADGGETTWGVRDADAGVAVLRLPPAALRATLLGARAWDVVHAHGPVPPAVRWAWLGAHVGRRALVVSPHGAASPPARWLAARADALVVGDVAEVAGVAPGARVAAVGWAAAPAAAPWRPPGVPPDAEMVLFAGALDWTSGALALVDALRLRRLAGRPTAAVVLGSFGDAQLRRLWGSTAVPTVALPVCDDATWRSLLAGAAVVVLGRDAAAADAVDACAAGVPVVSLGGGVAGLPAGVVLPGPVDSPPALADVLDAARSSAAPARAWAAGLGDDAALGARVAAACRDARAARAR